MKTDFTCLKNYFFHNSKEKFKVVFQQVHKYVDVNITFISGIFFSPIVIQNM